VKDLKLKLIEKESENRYLNEILLSLKKEIMGLEFDNKKKEVELEILHQIKNDMEINIEKYKNHVCLNTDFNKLKLDIFQSINNVILSYTSKNNEVVLHESSVEMHINRSVSSAIKVNKIICL
jgi:hypothetical protein